MKSNFLRGFLSGVSLTALVLIASVYFVESHSLEKGYISGYKQGQATIDYNEVASEYAETKKACADLLYALQSTPDDKDFLNLRRAFRTCETDLTVCWANCKSEEVVDR